MESGPPQPRSVVVGTAGHVDHGKSSLVEALTGTNPDRLKEEQERGITIDLGFAHLPDAACPLSFVDVPGHERFVRNMLAGAQGVDVLLLVVAADESVMPQTREHLDICRLLDVGTGVVALTKKDLVDAETLELARLEVAELVAGTFLASAPVVPCSAVTREGLPEILACLREAARRAPPRSLARPFRLPIDRVFTLKGFGTVVTGTATSGAVSPGDEIEILPAGRRARVRGVQVHGVAASRGEAGSRVALNLGGIDHDTLARGDVVVLAGSHVASQLLDVSVQLLPGAPDLKDLARVRLHVGTAEVMARIRWAGGPPAEGGSDRQSPRTGVAQLRLERPVVAAVGDRFILRRYSPVETVGGGVVLDPRPVAKRRRTDPAEGLRAAAGHLASRDEQSVLVRAVLESGRRGVSETELAASWGLSPVETRERLGRASAEGRVTALGTPARWLSAQVVAEAEGELVALLERFHRVEKLQEGMSKQLLLQAMNLSEPVFAALLARAEAAGRVRVTRDLVAVAKHQVQLSPDEERARAAILAAHRDGGLQAPDLTSVVEAAGVPKDKAGRLVKLLTASGELVKLKEGMLVSGEAMARLVRDMASWYRVGEAFSVPDFKERSGVSRKHAIPLLEHLDARGLTRRVGEGRVWTGRGAPESAAAAPPEEATS